MNDRAEQRNEERRDKKAKPETVCREDDRERDVATDEIERTMRQIDDAHDPEDDGQSGRQKKQDHPQRQAIENLDCPKVHHKALLTCPRGRCYEAHYKGNLDARALRSFRSRNARFSPALPANDLAISPSHSQSA